MLVSHPPEETKTVTLNVDTDGDLQAVPLTPDPTAGDTRADFRAVQDWDAFADVTSRDLGALTGRMVAALAHRSDDDAAAALQHLYETLGRALGPPPRS